MKPSVLVLTSSYPRWPGDATTPFVHQLSTGLATSGWAVTILAPHAAGAATAEDLDGLTIRRFRYWWPASGETVCYSGGAMANLRERPIDRLKVGPLVVAELAATSRLLRRFHFDVVHAHWLLPQGFAATLARPQTPVVTTVHGGDVFSLRSRALERVKAGVLRRSTAVTVNSGATRAAVAALAAPLQRIETIPMPVSTSPPDIARAAQLRTGWDADLVIGFIGRLVEEKGIDDVLEGFRLITARLGSSRLVVVGDGPGAPLMDVRIRQLGLQDRVTRLGWIEAQEMSTHLASFDTVVVPSRTHASGWIEAQGLVPLEAMAARVPVVASRVGGLTESVLHERTGLQVDEGRPDQIAEAVLRLHHRPDLRERVIRGGLALIETRYSRGAAVQAMDEVLRWAASTRAA